MRALIRRYLKNWKTVNKFTADTCHGIWNFESIAIYDRVVFISHILIYSSQWTSQLQALYHLLLHLVLISTLWSSRAYPASVSVILGQYDLTVGICVALQLYILCDHRQYIHHIFSSFQFSASILVSRCAPMKPSNKLVIGLSSSQTVLLSLIDI